MTIYRRGILPSAGVTSLILFADSSTYLRRQATTYTTVGSSVANLARANGTLFASQLFI